ncbi:MAG: hypothetical protein IAE80_10885 [Anaerolinea sp.]|nr:hypothetical protein [Anaerolinea sp.]
MAVKLYVGHLALHVTQAQIEALFRQVGNVTDSFLVTNRYTGKSNGFAFLNLDSEVVALEAVQRFNGYVLDGLALTVHLLVDSEKATIRKLKLPEAPGSVETGE